MAGNARPLVLSSQSIWRIAALVLLLGSAAVSQELYKYQDENGDWIYTDKPPEDGQVVETRELERAPAEVEIYVDVTHTYNDENVLLTARNDLHAPVEIRLEIAEGRGLELPRPDHPMTWILPARSEVNLLQLAFLQSQFDVFLEYNFRYMPGDPRAAHEPTEPYRAPFAMSSDHQITQAYPDTVTHSAPDSYYAVDIAMPIGTDIVAARDGVVFDTASTNYRSGMDAEEDGPAANVVKILHDDGTYAIYAHLNTNTIRVRPGDVVEKGQYIADSGNTGFSSGPHLHFAVVRNVGLRVRSEPVTFLGVNSAAVVPATGNFLAAY